MQQEPIRYNVDMTWKSVCQERKLYTGVRSGFSQGREDFLE